MLMSAARGDDFCGARLAFLFPTSGPAELPLDDPNTNFVKAADPVLTRQGKAQGDAGPEGLGRANALPALRARCSALTSHLASRRALRAGFGTRLRC